MHDGAPLAWVERFAPRVAPGAAVLDLACGSGRHTRLFVQAGHPVTAVDIDLSGLGTLAEDPRVEAIQADLEGEDGWAPLRGRSFGGIVVTNYLHRPLLDPLVEALAPGGVLIYATFSAGNAELGGRVKNPDYLLEPGELLDLVRGRLRVIAYEDVVEPGSPPAAVQRICAVRPDGPPVG